MTSCWSWESRFPSSPQVKRACRACTTARLAARRRELGRAGGRCWGAATRGLPWRGVRTPILQDPRVAAPANSLSWAASWCEEERRSLDVPDTHLGPLPHGLRVGTLVPDAAEVGEQQDVASVPEASFGNQSRLAKANRSPGLGQEPALQLLGALHLQEIKQVSASPPAPSVGWPHGDPQPLPPPL